VAQRRLYFLVGLFVSIGLMLGVAAVIWLGASKYFQKGTLYATYFDESVQGLQVDSIVKYRGVDVGSVRKIGVAPDRRLVEVVMKIEVGGFNVGGVVAKLTLAGITGIVYVELDRKKPGEPGLRPTGFEASYPVIPSVRSDITQIEQAINEVLKSIKQIDFKGISDQVMKTAKAVDNLASGERTERMMKDAAAAAARLASISEEIDRLLAGGSLEEILVGARDAVREARAVIARMKAEIEAVRLAQTADKVNRFIERTSGRVDSTLTEVQVTAETLRRTVDSLQALVDRLNADPSALLFSRPPEGE